MRVLIDTNVLVRSVQRKHPSSRAARHALVALYRGDCSLFITPQNVAEFWNVCTRPKEVNGIGLSIEAANRYVDQMQKFLVVLADTTKAFQAWRKLVVEHAVKGAKVHDARLVASMRSYGIGRILTFNVGDFSRYGDIEAIHPDTVA
ncbi:MAG: PIN domain-containing protein [Bryobacteraceae bacterium]